MTWPLVVFIAGAWLFGFTNGFAMCSRMMEDRVKNNTEDHKRRLQELPPMPLQYRMEGKKKAGK